MIEYLREQYLVTVCAYSCSWCLTMAGVEAARATTLGPPGRSLSLVDSAAFTQQRDYQSIEREVPEAAVPAPANPRVCYQKGTCREHLVYFCALSVGSYVGVLARIYLAELAQWNGLPLFPSFYAEVVGTTIMGLAISHKKLLEGGHKALYQAIATGLCGSITTFSSWNFEAASVLLQLDREEPDNAARIIGWATILLLGLGMPFAALCFGKHLSLLSPWSDQRVGDKLPYEAGSLCHTITNITIVGVWVCSTTLIVVLPYQFNQFELLFSFVLASAGTYTRWHLAPLNSLITNFKLGTMVANVLGSWILGGTAVVWRRFEGTFNDMIWAVLSGIATGFCGCLTTVSTFAVELTVLTIRGSYFYSLCSIILAQVGLIVIQGAYEWTK